MKAIISFCVGLALAVQIFNQNALASTPFHGKLSFTVTVNHINTPFAGALVEVFMKGEVVARGNTNEVGVVRLEVANYLHEPTNIRVSSAGYISQELQGVQLVNNRNYPFGLVKGEGLQIIQVENNVETINQESEERVRELEAERAKAEAERKAAEEKAQAAREEAERRRKEAAEQAQQTDKSLEEQRLAREKRSPGQS